MLHPLEEPRRRVRDRAAVGARGPGGRLDRLHPRVRRPDPPVGAAARYRVLGTDGFGRSDYRRALRRFFEVDRHYVAVAALKELADDGAIEPPAGAGGDRALRDRPRRADADHRMSATGAVSVEVPDIGDFDDVPVIEILVSPGDTVAVDDPLLTLESDKATMDVPAPFAGHGRRAAREGRRPRLPGHAAADAGADRATAPASAGAAQPADAVEAPTRAPTAVRASAAEPRAGLPPGARAGANGGGPVYASPSVRRLARELGVDLHAGDRQRPQGPDHQGRRPALGVAAPAGAGCAPAAGRPGSGPRSAAMAVGRLREVRRRRARRSARGSSGSRRRTWPATG